MQDRAMERQLHNTHANQFTCSHWFLCLNDALLTAKCIAQATEVTSLKMDRNDYDIVLVGFAKDIRVL
jgi:hypothetical protein